MAKRRRVGNLLALAVLALVAERPTHPYEMAATMRERGTEQNLKVKWGSLYTVVANLDKHGLIEATGTTRQGRRPERTVYSITNAGRAELTDWMRELVADPEKEHHRFQAALSLLGVLPPEEATALLELRLLRLEADVAAQVAALARHSQEIPRLFLVESEYELAIRQAEVGWVRGLLTEIRGGTLPGLDDWHAFHTTGDVSPELAKLAERGREPD